MAFTIQFTTMLKVRVLWNLVVLGLACFLITGADCKRSACWRYGHVCWGGHGKRSGPPPPPSISGSAETDVGPMTASFLPLSSQWNLPEINSETNMQLQPLPLVMDRVPIAKMRSQLSPSLLLMQPQLHAGKPSSRFNRMALFPTMLRQNDQKQGLRGLYELNDIGMLDDALIIPNEELMATFKRTGNSIQGKIKGGTRGTEEPLVTSANGQDTFGSVATFFRDRKTPANSVPEILEPLRYSTASSSSAGKPSQNSVLTNRRFQIFNPVDNFPMTQEYNILKPKTRLDY